MKMMLIMMAVLVLALGQVHGLSMNDLLVRSLTNTENMENNVASSGPGHCDSFAVCEPRRRGGVSRSNARAVQNLLSAWERAVTVENDSGKVASLFCQDSVLWGTVSDNLRTTREEIKSYFDYFAVSSNQVLGSCSFMQHSGRNAITDERAVQWSLSGNVVCARMTFETVRESGGWCIKSLHSSVMPIEPDALVKTDEANKMPWTTKN